MKNLISLFIFLILFGCDKNLSRGGGNQNFPPQIQGSFKDIRVGENFFFSPEVYDSEGDYLLFSIQGKPEWAKFNTQNGNITGKPSIENFGDIYQIKIAVTDGKETSYLGPLSLKVIPAIFFITLNVDGIDNHRDMELYLESCLYVNSDTNCLFEQEKISINKNGITSFQSGIESDNEYLIELIKEPGRQNCTIEEPKAVIRNYDLNLKVHCFPDESSPLYDLNIMHKIRLTMTVDEWNRFILDSQRARYTTGDANENTSGLISHSEIYRQVDFEYLNENNEIIETLTKVGFKMKGSSGRRWPEYSFKNSSGAESIKPKRFNFTLKFNEIFDEDEGVYSCIDSNGNPAPVEPHPCYSRVGKNLEEVQENKGRRFMDQKKIFFRFNRDDPSYQRELLAHDLLNSLGIPSSRVSHGNVELIITGAGKLYGRPLPHFYNMGVFQMTEQVDKTFLKRFFGENGYLFKIGANADLSNESDADSNCSPYEQSFEYENSSFCIIGIEKPDPSSREEWLGTDVYLNPAVVNSDINNDGFESQFKPYRPKYDLKTQKDEIIYARHLLQDFMIFLQNTSAHHEQLSSQFDVDGFIKAQALEITIGAVDHYTRVGNNYYLYFNPSNQKWIYIPNDFDFVFRDSHDASIGRPPWANALQDIAQTYVFPRDGEIDWASRQLGVVNPILWNVIFSEESNRNKLYIQIKQILDNGLIWEKLEKKLIARNALVEDAIRLTDAGNPEGCGFIYDRRSIDADKDVFLCDDYDISIKSFIQLRRQTLSEELNYL